MKDLENSSAIFRYLFFGWEGVGLCSYLLIGFWYTDLDKAIAGKKAFITNRVGDFGVIFGIIIIALTFNTISFQEIKVMATSGWAGVDSNLMVLACLMLLLGVTGKSAQIPLYVWLPDAMAGPTPVSALIHAATMVTAGVFLLCRVSPILISFTSVMEVIAWTGASTALFSALMALTQRDIKKVLAYSTISQLGYMVLACGVGAFSTGMFHVFTHAFFKALLFLGAGAIIHCLHHEQDMFFMGGLKEKMPKTFFCFLAGYLAIIGFPGLSGFFSKDEILWLTLNHPGTGKILYTMALVTALLTTIYMTRLMALVFLVKDKTQLKGKLEVHEPPMVMLVPLIVLAIGSVFVGYLGLPHFLTHDNARSFQEFAEMASVKMPAVIYSSHTEHLLMGMTIFLTFLCAGLVYYIYVVKEEDKLNEKLRYKFSFLYDLSFTKFKIDELYGILIIKPYKAIATVAVELGERLVIDGFVRFLGQFTYQTGIFLRTVRTVDLQGHMLMFVFGIAVILMIVFSSIMAVG